MFRPKSVDFTAALKTDVRCPACLEVRRGRQRHGGRKTFFALENYICTLFWNICVDYFYTSSTEMPFQSTLFLLQHWNKSHHILESRNPNDRLVVGGAAIPNLREEANRRIGIASNLLWRETGMVLEPSKFTRKPWTETKTKLWNIRSSLFYVCFKN